MKRIAPTFLAVSLLLTAGCTTDQIAVAGLLAGRYLDTNRSVEITITPGGRTWAEEPVAYVEDIEYVRIPLNRPGLAGRLRTMGIDDHRLPADACRISADGDLLVHPAYLDRFGRPGARLWLLVDVEGAVGSGRTFAHAARHRNDDRYGLVVIELHDQPAKVRDRQRSQTGDRQGNRRRGETWQVGRDCSLVSDETNIVVVNNINTYNYYYGNPPAASPTPTPEPTPTATPTPAPTPTPAKTPKPHDDHGHGNDPGKFDPSNPGKSKRK